jgi:hypothetical protein
LPVIDPAPIVPLQLPSTGAEEFPKSATVAPGPSRGNAVPELPSMGLNVVKPENIPSVDRREETDPSPVAPGLSPVKSGTQVATNLPPAVTSADQDALATAPNSSVNIPPSGIVDSTSAEAPVTVPAVDPAAVPGVIRNALSDALQMAASRQWNVSVPSAAQRPHPAAPPAVASGTALQSVADTGAKSFPDTMLRVATTEVSAVVKNAASSPPTPVSSESSTHGGVNGSAKGDVAQKSNAVPADQAGPPPPGSDGLSTAPNVLGATADQLAALTQPNGPLLVTDPAHVSNMSPVVQEKPSEGAVNAKEGAGSSVNVVTGLNQHGQVDSASSSSQPVSQDASSSSDQSQGSTSQQGQNTPTAQPNFPNHSIVDHAQSAGVAVSSQTPPAPAGVPDHPAKTSQTAAPATVVVPQAVPVINTAKLIQSMGQSEMRVGMRSTEFGNISISTSATRDLISAQISLDHGELARALATHLPEMQAKFGGNESMNVRIDMNGQQPAGHSAATSTGMSNESADNSRGGQQQRSSGPSRQSAEGFAGQLNSIPAAVLPSVESRLDARLDIRV